MNNVERAVDNFKQGFNCSQSVCAAYNDQFGLNQDLALRISGAFGGGMGRMAETCGAVTGAVMIIGLKYASTTPGDIKTKENAYAMVREFVDRFKARNHTILCHELLECDISTPEGMKHAREQKLIPRCCPKFVKDAAEILEQILAVG
jgi:C_GCAxxG_C_C family probable redox protein